MLVDAQPVQVPRDFGLLGSQVRKDVAGTVFPNLRRTRHNLAESVLLPAAFLLHRLEIHHFPHDLTAWDAALNPFVVRFVASQED